MGDQDPSSHFIGRILVGWNDCGMDYDRDRKSEVQKKDEIESGKD